MPPLARRQWEIPRVVAVHPLQEGSEDLPASSLLRLVGAGRLMVEEAERWMRQSVADARAAGCSWTSIAEELGVTRQAATQRFGP